jgi:hypothetical protein
MDITAGQAGCLTIHLSPQKQRCNTCNTPHNHHGKRHRSITRVTGKGFFACMQHPDRECGLQTLSARLQKRLTQCYCNTPS